MKKTELKAIIKRQKKQISILEAENRLLRAIFESAKATIEAELKGLENE